MKRPPTVKDYPIQYIGRIATRGPEPFRPWRLVSNVTGRILGHYLTQDDALMARYAVLADVMAGGRR